jgi:lysophospholipase L1-like esterase
MIWNKVVCVGDSITFGARTYVGYPEYLSVELEKLTGIFFDVINEGISGERLIDVIRRLPKIFCRYQKVGCYCVIVGTNDVKERTDVKVFEMLYRQMIMKFMIQNTFLVVGEIPRIVRGKGWLPYGFWAMEHRKKLNDVIRKVVNEIKSDKVRLVSFDDLSDDCFVDSVHLSDKGCREMAKIVAKAIYELAV